MKVELDKIILGHSSLSDSVFAGVPLKPGVWRHKVNVTKSFLDCVIDMWENKSQIIEDDDNKWEITVKKIK